MAAKKTKKAPTRRTKTVVADPGVAAPEQRELKAFYDGGGQMPDFSYARFYWAGGDGPRESLLPRLAKKRQPVGADVVPGRQRGCLALRLAGGAAEGHQPDEVGQQLVGLAVGHFMHGAPGQQARQERRPTSLRYDSQ